MRQIDDLHDIAETLRGDGYDGDIPDAIDAAADTIEQLARMCEDANTAVIISTQNPPVPGAITSIGTATSQTARS